ncbi:MAG TPA: prolyl oligopeptidase family serine peptidase [Pyrinomonadaceae bacterium]|nr:prolyl oligopeptidase family serine peptidase [Pyrinomonadaceae bacterium]
MKRIIHWGAALSTLLMSVGGLFVVTVRAEDRPSLPYSVEDSWRTATGLMLSNNGQWLAYQVRSPNGDGLLIVRNIATGHEYREHQAGNATFTPDSRYVVFLVSPTKSDMNRTDLPRESHAKARLGILDLSAGTTHHEEGISNYKLPAKNSNVVAMLKAPTVASSSGAQLIVLNVKDGIEKSFDQVVDYGFTADGRWIVYVVAGQGVFASRIGSDEYVILLTEAGSYSPLILSAENPQVAFLATARHSDADMGEWQLYYWDARCGEPHAIKLAEPSTRGMLPGYRVSPRGALSFSKDGERLFFYTIPSLKEHRSEEQELAKLEVWWTKGALLPAQQRMVELEYVGSPAVVHLSERRLVQLGNAVGTGIVHNQNARFALILATVQDPSTSWLPYGDCGNSFSYCDVYLSDLASGVRTLIFSRSRYAPYLSPNGEYVLVRGSTRAERWTVLRTSDLKRTMLSESLALIGWASDRQAIFSSINSDVLKIDLESGVAQNVTASYRVKNNIRFIEYVKFDLTKQNSQGSSRSYPDYLIDDKEPLIFRGVDDATLAEGFYRLNINERHASVAEMTKQDIHFRMIVKARDADVIALTRERFDMVPDIYLTDSTFKTMRRVSDVEPRQKMYAWGQSKLIEYRNAEGKKMRAILTVPGNFDPSKRYPMLVYIYEKRSGFLHWFVKPEPEGGEPNVSWYASNGYVVLQPDIDSHGGQGGQAAVACVVPAVLEVLKSGFVEPKRIGLVGHSWGGFEAFFLLTHTDLFAAVVAGAGTPNMVSWYNQLRLNQGTPAAALLEDSDVWLYMRGTLWDQREFYLQNSPVLDAPRASAPVLILANDGDRNVTWYQSLEMFLALRRLGKEAWLLNYKGEDHEISDPNNRKDVTVRMSQFLGHYLKRQPAANWMQQILRSNSDSLQQVKGTSNNR